MSPAKPTAAASFATALRADRRAIVSVVLIGSIALSFLLALLGIHGTLRELIALLAFTFAPGAAVMMRLRPVDALAATGLSAAISLAVIALGAWLMIEIGWYVPWLLITIVMAVAGFALLGEVMRVRRAVLRGRDPQTENEPTGDEAELEPTGSPAPESRPYAATLAAGLLLWLLSLNSIDLDAMTDVGVVSVLPAGWLIGFALLLGGGLLYAVRGGRNLWLLAGFVAAVATMIYGTLPLVADAAHYPAAYKHVGVVQMFIEHGHLRPNADIYNRWPGFFALAGVFTRFSGAADAIRHIGWAELYFIVLQTALVAAITLRVFRRAGTAALAALIFLTINWIGQNYYSPQALVFVLGLAALWVTLDQLGGEPNRLGELVDRIAGWVSRSAPPASQPPAPRWSLRQAIALLMLMQAAIVVSHQLTPYALGLQLGLLLICGFARPVWLIAAIAILPIIYLLPHLGWINDHFGIFTKLDPFSNAQVNDPIAVKCDGCATVGSMATLNSGLAWLGAIAGAILLTRRGSLARPQVLLMLMLAPFLFLAGQNYGGEAPLRVVMFASPFTAALIAGALMQLRPLLRQLVGAGLIAVLGLSLLFAFYGGEPFSAVSRAEVRVAKHIYAKGEKGQVIMSAAPTFPDLLAANYTDFIHLNGGGQIILFDLPGEQQGKLTGDVDGVQFVADQLRMWGYDGYIVFSPNTDRYNAFNSLASEEQSRQVREAMVASGRFRLWHKDGDVEVFEFVK